METILELKLVGTRESLSVVLDVLNKILPCMVDTSTITISRSIEEGLRSPREALMAVQTWARDNDTENFLNGSPYSYYSSALNAGIITEDEFNYFEELFGETWNPEPLPEEV